MMLKARSPSNDGRRPQGSVKQVLIIYGPTQTGKTSLSIKLAKKYSGELISADSRQVYKGLDIGSGKVGFDDVVEKHTGFWTVNGIRINGFDLANPGNRFTAADFLQSAESSMIRIIEHKKLPILVGGTGFYIKALLEGIGSIGIPADLKLRRRLEKLSSGNLYKQLLSIDPKRAKSMNQSDRANPRRLIRAIEIAFSNQKVKITGYRLPTTDYLLIGLTAPNEYLYEKADEWLEKRIQNGLANEVKGLFKAGVDARWLESLGLEYRWVTKYLLGQISYDETLIRLRGDIHSFIRRQKTWFSKFKNIKLFDISAADFQISLEKTVNLWYTKENERRKVPA